MTKKPVAAHDKFMLRLPDGMRDAIAKRADANGRSMNSEIVQILQDAIYGGVSLPMDDEFSNIYQEMLESDNWDDDASYEKIDYLIYMFMERMADDSRKFRELLDLKKERIDKK
ncbi:Arc family DNA-binding protein [Providencia heimbachae]|uniref:Arc family DNA-binding protein n=1 Tax=Providencia heimbachae TaxID=333962 RepID=UPI0014196BAA|nr:Arc family DNA-binding protein [Providencia heimbachae]NIH23377.1 Arc family DNA-binding protein [Providencia heimbachae]